MRGFIKKLSHSQMLRRAFVWLLACYLRLVYATSRWQVEGSAERDRLFAEGQPFLIALWHNRIGMMPFAWYENNHNLMVMASGHRDGQLVIDTMGRFGFGAIAVDSRGGGSAAARQAVKALRAGRCVGITPDGPRGPRLVVKEGIIQIAALARVPIVPVSYATARRRQLRSWDHFMLPLPFSKGLCRWGAPLWVPERPDANQIEACRQALEGQLNEVTDMLDRAFGHAPVARVTPQSGETR